MINQTVNLDTSSSYGLLHIGKPLQALNLGNDIQFYQAVTSLLDVWNGIQLGDVLGTYIANVGEPAVNEPQSEL